MEEFITYVARARYIERLEENIVAKAIADILPD